MACPISWYATKILLFPSVIFVPSIPATILSIESSISAEVILSFPLLPARMAASFMRLARSAPLNPGVLMAITLRDTSLSSFLLLLCTFRISSLPLISGLFVAAMTMTPVLPVNPSISVSNWLRVCSLSSFPPPMPVPLCRPTASISSMNTRQDGHPYVTYLPSPKGKFGPPGPLEEELLNTLLAAQATEPSLSGSYSNWDSVSPPLQNSHYYSETNSPSSQLPDPNTPRISSTTFDSSLDLMGLQFLHLLFLQIITGSAQCSATAFFCLVLLLMVFLGWSFPCWGVWDESHDGICRLGGGEQIEIGLLTFSCGVETEKQ
nr:Uncharacterised protein [Ipomoea batatas]